MSLMQDASASRATRIETQLRTALHPLRCEITDDSARHAGHAGARAEGQTHYSVLVVADAFAGQSRVARSRTVHELLAGEFASGLHALALTLRTPEEQAAAETRT
jgi:stress-induced morphogen